MDSPINPGVWRFLFNVAVGSLATATLASVYHQKWTMQSTVSAPFRQLSKAKSEEDLADQLQELLTKLQNEAVKKQFGARLSGLAHGAFLVKLIRLAKDGSNADSCLLALKTIKRVYGPDADGRKKLNKLGGYRVMLSSLSEAHRQGNQDLLEEFAATLADLTEVDDSEVVLASDVPEGGEGAYALATMPATAKMLRILDPESPVLFLSSLTQIFANLCTLSAGSENIGKGTDGHSGISFFLTLLDHSNRTVVENCVVAIRFMVRADVGHAEMIQTENVDRLAENLSVNAAPNVVFSIFTIILVMTGSDLGEEFFTLIAESTIPTALFDIWMGSSEPVLRKRADTLCHLLTRLPPTKAIATALFTRYAGQIEERHAKDEQEKQRQQQQMQQQQMMQRMMMEQMGMDPSMMGA